MRYTNKKSYLVKKNVNKNFNEQVSPHFAHIKKNLKFFEGKYFGDEHLQSNV